MSNGYDVVLVSSADDLKNIEFKLPYILKNLKPKKLVIICSKNAKNRYLINLPNILVLDEDNLVPGLSIQEVKDELYFISGFSNRAGWYFQQFLKMSYAYLSTTDYYLIWDADTIPLKQIDFFDMNNRPQFTIKTEYHKPYFTTIKNIINCDKIINGSFIAEHMLINKYIMQELIEDIVKKHNIKTNGNCMTKDFWKIILRNIDITEISGSGFSEFETYGTFVTHQHPNIYVRRVLQTCRNAAKILGLHPSEELLQWASKDYDIISLEKWTKHSPTLSRVSKHQQIRKLFSMKLIMLVSKIL